MAMPEAEIRRILAALARRRFTFKTEEDLYPLLAEVFEGAGLAYRKQAQLSPEDRIDFMLGTVGVEVKVKGGLAEVTRQLHRYAQHESVSGLVLVTSKARHTGVPSWLNNKPVAVHPLFVGGAF